ncbi:RNA polymerase sigma factor [Sphingobacterium multivorum]|uniref:RNA polymerase sigma factor n=1 Tax=Sphingobacterium multivorum TaxID=28454 RepID=UPI000FC02DF5|nr:RNA polymerase sigma-70 factor [Sphingobacterium multivorum]
MKADIILPEKELINRVKSGDQDAFEQLYKSYSRKLTYRLLHLLKSEELAQDILQDVFLKVWEVRDRLDPELSFGAFLFTIASNYCKKSFRKALLDQVYYHHNTFEEAYSPIEWQLDQKDAQQVLATVLEKLTPRQKEVFTLHKIEGHSYKEISERLGISTNTINQLMQQANKQLKAGLLGHSLLLAAILLH